MKIIDRTQSYTFSKYFEMGISPQDLAKEFGEDTILIRNYLGVDYEVTLTTKGMLLFNGEYFDTPNKLYNNGIVKFVKGKKGGSGTNNLSQFIIKENNQRLKD